MLSLRSAAPLLGAALVSIAAVGCGGTRPADMPTASGPVPMVAEDGSPVVASWTDVLLSLDQYEDEYMRAEGGIDLASLSADSLRERRLDFLERYVDFRLKVRAARAAGYDQDSSYMAEIEDYRDDLAGPYFTDAEILDDIVRDIYEKSKEEIEVSHLLLLANDETPPEDTLARYNAIQAIRDSIVTGQITFREAAINNSEDPSVSRPEGQLGSGGDLNWLTAGRTVLPFEDAMYDTPVGSVSEPVRSQYGYHLVYVTDRRPTPSQISARHILIRWSGGTPEDSASTRAQIAAIQDRLGAGESFEALATELSEDPGSAERGGDLGTFGPGRMVAPFEAAAYALEAPGDVSGPVETQFGVHLIQLSGVTPFPSFEEQYDAIKRTAQGLPRTSLRRLEVGREERAARGAEFFPDAIRAALMGVEADSTVLFAARGFGDAAADTFATLDGTAYTLEDLGQRVRGARINTNDNAVEAIVDFADEVLTSLAVDAAVASLEDRNPEFARLFQGYAQGVLLFRIAEDSVWTKASEDSLGLQRVYEANRSQYRWPERRRILAFRTPGDSLLRAVEADLSAGMSPEAVFAKHDDTRFALRLDTLRIASRTDTPLDASFDLAVGEHTEVLPERSRLAVYYLDGIEEPREKTFAEARAEVIADYQDQLEREWSARLRQQFGAQTYPDRVPAVPPGMASGGVWENPQVPTETQ